MGSFAIFDNGIYMLMSIISLILLFCACAFSERSGLLKQGIWFIFAALVTDFLASWIEAETTIMYAHNHPGYIQMLYCCLTLFVLEMLILAMAASLILFKRFPNMILILSIAVIAAVSLLYFVFISRNSEVVYQMRYIFPLAGFSYLAVSFSAQIGRKYASGSIFATMVSAMAAIFLLFRFLGVSWTLEDSYIWFIPSLITCLFALSILLIRINVLHSKLDDAKREINKNNSRLQDIVKSSPFPIIISRLSDDKIILANNNAIKLFGILPQEVERYRLRDFFVDADNRRLLTEKLEHEREVQDFDILVKTPTGDSPFWLLASANIIDYNNVVAMYSAFQDITGRKNREMLLKNQAIRDPLTSLYNRRYFEEEVFNRILIAKTARESYSVLMIDADHFKRVNDTYGHKTGDKVLIELAATAEKALRDNDIVARYGGEEFVIFLDKANAEKAETVAERLRQSISSIVVYSDEGEEVRFTVSIGVSSSEVSDNVETLIKTADEALYRAKQTGRNRVEVFRSEDMHQFNNQQNSERKEENITHHPVFDGEDNREISLLDGIPSSQIYDDNVEIEDKSVISNDIKS